MKKISLVVLLSGAIAVSIWARVRPLSPPRIRISTINTQLVPDTPLTDRPQLDRLQTGGTTIDQLTAILREEATDVQVDQGQISFKYEDRTMLILTSAQHDRMRLITPITKAEEITPEQRDNMLKANFHTALDGRYAVSNGIVFATFLHPLSTLQERDFRSALSQVNQLVQTFGSTYSSGALGFNAEQEQPLPAI